LEIAGTFKYSNKVKGEASPPSYFPHRHVVAHQNTFLMGK